MYDSPTVRAFLAGLIEGDGYLGYQFKLRLIDQDLVQYVADLLHRRISQTTPTGMNKKPLYEVNMAKKRQVAEFYQWLYPWLGTRRQAQIRAYFNKFSHLLYEDLNNLQSIIPQPPKPPGTSIQSKELTEEERAYLAGYFAAEGSIGFDKRLLLPTPYLSFESTDQDIIAYVAQLLGQHYVQLQRRTKKNKLVFRVRVHALNDVQKSLKLIKPYLSMSARHTAAVDLALTAFDSRQKVVEDPKLMREIKEVTYRHQIPNVPTTKTGRILQAQELETLAMIFQDRNFLVFVKTSTLKNGPVRRIPRIVIKSTDRHLVEQVSQILETPIRQIKVKRRTNEPIFMTQLEYQSAVQSILTALLPLLKGESYIMVHNALKN